MLLVWHNNQQQTAKQGKLIITTALRKELKYPNGNSLPLVNFSNSKQESTIVRDSILSWESLFSLTTTHQSLIDPAASTTLVPAYLYLKNLSDSIRIQIGTEDGVAAFTAALELGPRRDCIFPLSDSGSELFARSVSNTASLQVRSWNK